MAARPKLSGSNLAAEFAAALPQTEAERPARGRPPKAGADGTYINCRVSAEDYAALTEAAVTLRERGRPAPTLQDVVRRCMHSLLKDPELLRRLYEEAA